MVASGQGTTTSSGKGYHLLLLAPLGPLHLGLALLLGHPPEDWLQTFLSSRSLDLAAIDTKLVAVNLKLWIQSFIVGAKALAKYNTNYLI